MNDTFHGIRGRPGILSEINHRKIIKQGTTR